MDTNKNFNTCTMLEKKALSVISNCKSTKENIVTLRGGLFAADRYQVDC